MQIVHKYTQGVSGHEAAAPCEHFRCREESSVTQERTRT